jgi:hypothetical protein
VGWRCHQEGQGQWRRGFHGSEPIRERGQSLEGGAQFFESPFKPECPMRWLGRQPGDFDSILEKTLVLMVGRGIVFLLGSMSPMGFSACPMSAALWGWETSTPNWGVSVGL